MADKFVDGEWYVLTGAGADGRRKAHFYQRLTGAGPMAYPSCGASPALVRTLSPSDDINVTKTHKVHPRERCARCWSVEVMKARRT